MLSKEESLSYFNSRPKGSQIGAWSSPQSQIIADRNELEKRVEHYQSTFKDDEQIPLPDFWGGYLIAPYMIEFSGKDAPAVFTIDYDIPCKIFLPKNGRLIDWLPRPSVRLLYALKNRLVE